MTAQKRFTSIGTNAADNPAHSSHCVPGRPMLQIPLSDDDWARVQSLFPDLRSTRGRPRRSDREILNAILWVQQKKEKWHRLPANFPPQQTCYLRYMTWKKTGVLDQVNKLLPMCGQEWSSC
ncbi:transposase [Paraburkholderia dioscoreae]|uniref:Transposase n=2 Tax=Burkholderiaceae TaxID=119060 RepID=A0A5Q4YYL1_9BURK|nr:transposase [Paraburkholderia dioscoreae]